MKIKLQGVIGKRRKFECCLLFEEHTFYIETDKEQREENMTL